MVLLQRIILCCIAISLVGGSAHARPPEKLKKLLDKATGPVTLKLLSADLEAATVEAQVSGVSREVSARMFVFHDERGRHFIAARSVCSAIEGAEALRCVLELPRFYFGKTRAKITGFTVNIHKHDYEADPKVVEELLNRPIAASTTATTGTNGEGGNSDGGVDGGHDAASPPPDATPPPPDASRRKRD